MQELQGPLPCGQEVRAQLHDIALFDVGREGQIEHMLVEREFELVLAQCGRGLHHLAVVQAQRARHGRIDIGRAHVEVHGRHPRNLVDALWAKNGHG